MAPGTVTVLALVLGAVFDPSSVQPGEKLARRTLDQWLAAQNDGAFDDYQKLYAADFTGVRRSGARIASLDRADWLKDRRRMFGKPMKVEAEKVRVFAKENTALVVFTQRWSSGRYSDVGPKHLVMRRASGGFRIVREELFASRTGKGAVDVAAFLQFAFVQDGEIVVSDDPDEGWASGPPVAEPKGADQFLVRTRRPVDTKKLPPAIARLAGAKIVLMDGNGLRCSARLGGFHLRGRVIADSYEFLMDEESAAAGDIWSSSNHLLVAKLDGDAKTCAGATWARSAELPAPAVAPGEPPSDTLKKRALAAFRALPETRALQRTFADWYGRAYPGKRNAPAWFQMGKGAQVQLLHVPNTSAALLSVTTRYGAGERGCDAEAGAGFEGSLWGLWRVDGTSEAPRLVLVNRPDPALTIAPTGAVDVDGDGQVELLFDRFQDDASINVYGQGTYLEHGLLRARDGAYVDVEGPETQVLICPC